MSSQCDASPEIFHTFSGLILRTPGNCTLSDPSFDRNIMQTMSNFACQPDHFLLFPSHWRGLNKTLSGIILTP